jgi:hypothetical protein
MGSTGLSMPMLVLSGEKAGGTFLIEQAGWWHPTSAVRS